MALLFGAGLFDFQDQPGNVPRRPVLQTPCEFNNKRRMRSRLELPVFSPLNDALQTQVVAGSVIRGEVAVIDASTHRVNVELRKSATAMQPDLAEDGLCWEERERLISGRGGRRI